MTDDPNQKYDPNKPICLLNSLPAVEQSVWTKLLTADLPVTRLVPQFDLAAVSAAFDVSKLAVAARMASEISNLTETARLISDVSKLGDVARLASELSMVAEAATVNPESYKVATYGMPDFSKIAHIDLADDTQEAIEKLAMRGWSLPWH